MKERNVFYIILNKDKNDLNIYKSIKNGLLDLRIKLTDMKIDRIAINKLDFDNLDWPRVKSLIESIFKDRNINIYVFNNKESRKKTKVGHRK